VNHLEHPSERGGLTLIALFFAASVPLNLVTPLVLAGARNPGMRIILVGTFLLGMVAGEAGLLAVWAVFGPQRLLVRWPASLLVTAVLWGVFLLGMASVIPGGVAEIARGTLMLPLILLAVQSPLWILKMMTGWRIVLAGTQAPASPAESRQFRLQHMLGATAVVAAAFGLASLGLPRVDGPHPRADTSLWLGLMWACMILYFLSGLSICPCLWAALVVRNKAAGAVAIVIYLVLMSALAVIVISALGGPSPPEQGMRLFVLLFGGLALAMLGGLHVARSCGYVLLQPRRMQSPESPREDVVTGADPFEPPSLPSC
jgi:hypothetical protein